MTIYIAAKYYYNDFDDYAWEYMPYDFKGHYKVVGIKWFFTNWNYWYFSEARCQKFCKRRNRNGND